MALIYDLEIIKAIPPKDSADRIEGIEYCDGWRDHKNMGISVLCAVDSDTMRSYVICGDNKKQFFELCEKADTLVSFNGIGFDNKVIAATWGYTVPENKCYDLLVEIWRACGLGPDFKYPSHAGFKLDYLLRDNKIPCKTGHGAFAPVDWQQGKYGKVIDYCVNDCFITALLYKRSLDCPIVIPDEAQMSNPYVYLRKPGQERKNEWSLGDK